MEEDLVVFGRALLENPIPVLTLLPPIFILYGAGKSLGLPLLFWHESRAKQALAGASTTWLTAEVLFVVYLLSGRNSEPAALVRFFVVGGAAWGLTVGIRAVLQEYRFRKLAGEPPGISRMSPSRPGLTPAIRQVEGPRTTELASVQVSSIPFMLGASVAAVIVAFFISQREALERTLGTWLFELLAPLLGPIPNPGLHGIAAAFFVLFIVTLLILARVPTRFRTPALDICVFLAIVAAAYGFLAFHLMLPGLILLAVTGLVLLAGVNKRKIRVPALAVYESTPVSYPPAEESSEGPPAPPTHGGEGVKSPFRFRSDGSALFRGGEEKPTPLVLVCLSGGGVRAATWTAAILAKLDRCSAFRSAARVLAGASGGMMGAASWVGSLHASREADPGPPPASIDWEDLVHRVSRDSLSDVTRQLVFRDLPCAFLPFPNRRDRGWALEQAWKRHLGEALELSFRDLEEGEKKGWWPSLVFSPMLVEDGRRLLMSNLDLQAVSINEVVWLSADGSDRNAKLEPASVSSYHLADVFPEAWPDFPISTAARLSAAFPYVSPAAVLPTTPRRRIVDAGYYDNYGLDLVSGWLREMVTHPDGRFWLEKNVSRILVVQIRDSVSELVVNPSDRRRGQAAEPGPLEVGLEGVTSPISAVLSARESVMLFRNDGQLEATTKHYRERMEPGFLTTTIFELKGRASLSWYLTEAEISAIKTQANSQGIERKLDAVARWLNR